MQFIGKKLVKISSLILPGDFNERKKAPHVKELAQSIDQTLLIHDPVVRESDNQLICGADRIAAFVLLGRKEILVTVVECTDMELSYLRDTENLRRRKLSQAQHETGTARLVAIQKSLDEEKKRIARERPETTPLQEVKKGRPESPATKVAKELGISARHVRRAIEDRTPGQKAKQPKPATKPERIRPPIDTLTIVMTPDRAKAIIEVANVFEDVVRHLRDAKSALTRAVKLAMPIDHAAMVEMENTLSGAIHIIRRYEPKTICLWCKERPDIVSDCSACGSSAYSTQAQFEDADKRLKQTGSDAVVMVGGKLSKYDQI